ncbi:oxygenase MpaB family protein [uncultured Mycobacterium sp.]|uniref:oxygenase MpaB family protein n=1 Tax=uncultured Mycobacterium sp. TaxID=171292 RepID=UPI0035CB4D7D
MALLGGYQFSGFNKTLLRTGALEKGSNQRFAETMQWAIDVISENGLTPLGAGYRSTLAGAADPCISATSCGRDARLARRRVGIPLNQTDMAATLVGALIAPPAAAIGMGMVLSPAELDAIAHLTRYLGWLIGVQDEWLPGSFRGGVRVLYHTLTALSNADESTRQLAGPMADDPLLWHYRSMAELRRRIARAQHLSVTSGFGSTRDARAGLAGLRAAVVSTVADSGQHRPQHCCPYSARGDRPRCCPRLPRAKSPVAHHDRRRRSHDRRLRCARE